MRSEKRSERGVVQLRLVLGLLILALGAIVLGENLGWIEGRDAFRLFWPAAFVAIGFTFLLQPSAGGPSRWWGLVWLVGGFWIFAEQRGWTELDFGDVFLPGLLLLVGGTLVWRVVAGDRPRSRRAAEVAGARASSFALMAGNEVRATTQEFRGADLTAIMGGVVLDLTQARIEGAEAVIDVFAVWGGIEIRVPKEWSVESRVAPLMAAYEDKTEPSTATPTGRLVVRGMVLMGGVEVKN
jgi:hypothetical protein